MFNGRRKSSYQRRLSSATGTLPDNGPAAQIAHLFVRTRQAQTSVHTSTDLTFSALLILNRTRVFTRCGMWIQRESGVGSPAMHFIRDHRQQERPTGRCIKMSRVSTIPIPLSSLRFRRLPILVQRQRRPLLRLAGVSPITTHRTGTRSDSRTDRLSGHVAGILRLGLERRSLGVISRRPTLSSPRRSMAHSHQSCGRTRPHHQQPLHSLGILYIAERDAAHHLYPGPAWRPRVQ